MSAEATADASRAEPQHMPQLDSLRAFAVFVVMIEHYIPDTDWIRRHIPCGTLGVRLFFVLSGYLITGILFRCRAQLEGGKQSLGAVLKSFFARRFIRLIPVYYVYLVAIAVTMPYSRQYLWWFVLYLQNFLFAARPEVFAKLLAHFWSLAVEEQFYLTWPLVVLLAPRAKLPAILAAFVLAGPILRGLGLLTGFSPLQVDMMMPAHFDTLAFGGLLAVLQRGDVGERPWVDRLTKLGLWVGGPSTILSIMALDQGRFTLFILFAELSMGLLFGYVVLGAAKGFRGPIGKLLEARSLRYLGQVSYGIYVFHFNVPWLVRKVTDRAGLALPGSPWARLAIFAVVTVLIASASWQLMEKPINRLKQRFTYGPSKQTSTEARAA